MSAIEQHIKNTFGEFENVFHELVSPDIHVDICLVPPSEERGYYTLVTMGMGAHRMNVPEELAEYKLERAELAIALPSDWKLDEESLKDERWCWPIGLLKVLARLPIASDTWLGWGHTMDKESSFAENTDLCASILISPQGVEEGNETCTLPNGEVVNFYQVIPLYRDEMEYKLENDVDALFEKMEDVKLTPKEDMEFYRKKWDFLENYFNKELSDLSKGEIFIVTNKYENDYEYHRYKVTQYKDHKECKYIAFEKDLPENVKLGDVVRKVDGKYIYDEQATKYVTDSINKIKEDIINKR